MSRLSGRASKTLVGLGRELTAYGDTVTKQQLEQSLRHFHLSLTVEVTTDTHVLNSLCVCTGHESTMVLHNCRAKQPNW